MSYTTLNQWLYETMEVYKREGMWVAVNYLSKVSGLSINEAIPIIRKWWKEEGN